MLIGLAIVNPVYFYCMMINAMKAKKILVSVILGTLIGPIFFLVTSEWAILIAGVVAGTIGYLVGRLKYE